MVEESDNNLTANTVEGESVDSKDKDTNAREIIEIIKSDQDQDDLAKAINAIHIIHYNPDIKNPKERKEQLDEALSKLDYSKYNNLDVKNDKNEILVHNPDGSSIFKATHDEKQDKITVDIDQIKALKKKSLDQKERFVVAIERAPRGSGQKDYIIFNKGIVSLHVNKEEKDKDGKLVSQSRIANYKDLNAAITDRTSGIKFQKMLLTEQEELELKTQKAAAELAAKQNAAATKIQTNVRGMLAKKTLANLKTEIAAKQNAAATKIQTNVRGMLAKKTLANLKTEIAAKNKAATEIQAQVRGMQGRNTVAKILKDMLDANTKLQPSALGKENNNSFSEEITNSTIIKNQDGKKSNIWSRVADAKQEVEAEISHPKITSNINEAVVKDISRQPVVNNRINNPKTSSSEITPPAPPPPPVKQTQQEANKYSESIKTEEEIKSFDNSLDQNTKAQLLKLVTRYDENQSKRNNLIRTPTIGSMLQDFIKFRESVNATPLTSQSSVSATLKTTEDASLYDVYKEKEIDSTEKTAVERTALKNTQNQSPALGQGKGQGQEGSAPAAAIEEIYRYQNTNGVNEEFNVLPNADQFAINPHEHTRQSKAITNLSKAEDGYNSSEASSPSTTRASSPLSEISHQSSSRQERVTIKRSQDDSDIHDQSNKVSVDLQPRITKEACEKPTNSVNSADNAVNGKKNNNPKAKMADKIMYEFSKNQQAEDIQGSRLPSAFKGKGRQSPKGQGR